MSAGGPRGPPRATGLPQTDRRHSFPSPVARKRHYFHTLAVFVAPRASFLFLFIPSEHACMCSRSSAQGAFLYSRVRENKQLVNVGSFALISSFSICFEQNTPLSSCFLSLQLDSSWFLLKKQT